MFKDFLYQYFQYHFLLKENGYQCEYCKEESNFSIKKTSVLEAPHLLAICFKRFHQGENGFQKNQLSFNLEKILNFSDFTITNSPKQKNFIYNIYAVIRHDGNLMAGHYITYIKKSSGKWYKISDSYYDEVQEKEVMNSYPYMVFYQKH